MGQQISGEGGAEQPAADSGVTRRESFPLIGGLVAMGRNALAFVGGDRLYGYLNALLDSNQCTEIRIPGEQEPVRASRLAVVVGGIGRVDCNDIIGVLGDAMSEDGSTTTSLIYSTWGLSPQANAEAIVATGCKDLTFYGHSIGGGHSLETIGALRPYIESGQINKPRVVFFNSPSSGRDVISPFAAPISEVPLGFATKSALDLGVYGHVAEVSVPLEESQLDFAVDFNAANVLPDIADLIDVEGSLYIGDAYLDSVIRTPDAANEYRRLLPGLRAVLVPGLGHPDPARNPTQARIYNDVLRDMRSDTLVTTP